ncbi:MAG: hypothetical protein RRZ33_09995, partial [Lachnospiraceae bacterium]
ALAGILTFADKVIDKEYKKRIKEEMQMTQIGQMLIDEGREQGMAQGREQGMAQGREQGREQGRAQGMAQGMAQGVIKIIHTMLQKNKTIEEIHNDTDVSIEEIKKIKELMMQ